MLKAFMIFLMIGFITVFLFFIQLEDSIDDLPQLGFML